MPNSLHQATHNTTAITIYIDVFFHEPDPVATVCPIKTDSPSSSYPDSDSEIHTNQLKVKPKFNYLP